MNIQSIIEVASSRLSAVTSDMPFREAAELFGSRAIRMLVVCNNTGQAIGVVTRTDALRHVAADADPHAASIARMMSYPIVSLRIADDLLTAWQMMLDRGLNHVPVLDSEERPIGILTSEDVLAALLKSEEYEEHLLSDYVAGLGYR